MDLVFSAEHDALRAATRSLLQRHAPESAVRAAMESEDGYDPAVWRRMAQEIGLQGLIVPEPLGGSGADFVDLGVAMEELGRGLYCGPFLSSAVLAATALMSAGDEIAARKYLPDVCSGSLLATVADDGLLGGRDHPVPAATSSAETVRIDGRVGYVLDGHIADILVVTARDQDEAGLYLVDARSAGIATTLLPTMDLTRKIAAVEFRGTEATMKLNRSGFSVYHEGVPGRENPVLKADSFRDGTIDHMQNFFDCIRTRKEPNAPVETGVAAARAGQIVNLAYRRNGQIAWPPKASAFPICWRPTMCSAPTQTPITRAGVSAPPRPPITTRLCCSRSSPAAPDRSALPPAS